MRLQSHLHTRVDYVDALFEAYSAIVKQRDVVHFSFSSFFPRVCNTLPNVTKLRWRSQNDRWQANEQFSKFKTRNKRAEVETQLNERCVWKHRGAQRILWQVRWWKYKRKMLELYVCSCVELIDCYVSSVCFFSPFSFKFLSRINLFHYLWKFFLKFNFVQFISWY